MLNSTQLALFDPEALDRDTGTRYSRAKGVHIKRAWHVTPVDNIESILVFGIQATLLEPHRDAVVAFFKTERDAYVQTVQWLGNRYKGRPLCLITVDIAGLPVDQTFPYELLTQTSDPVHPSRIIRLQPFSTS